VEGVPALLLSLALVVGLARAAGMLARRLGQPPVIGELAAGILVVPLFFTSGAREGPFGPETAADLQVVATIGIAIFMFLVGAEFDGTRRGGQGRLVGCLTVAVVVVPFGLGTGLGFWLVPEGEGAAAALFLGVALAVTAFPVLARIVADRPHDEAIGALALATAAGVDVLAWLLLAAVIGIDAGNAGGLWSLLLMLPYLAVMAWVVRPLLRWFVARGVDEVTRLAVLLVVVLLSAAATETTGLHLIFGAFLAGMAVPRDESLRRHLRDRVAPMNRVLLMPVFFVVAGLGLDLSSFDLHGSGLLGLVVVAAVLGKVGTAAVVGRCCGLDRRSSLRLGILLNTRGLTELIVLRVGLELGVIDGRTYSLLVVMALITTAMTGPLLRLAERRRVTEPARSAPDATR